MNRREAAITMVSASAPLTVKPSVLSASAEEWRGWMIERGYPAYRARQVLGWVIQRRAESFERMSDLPVALRRELAAEWVVFETRIAHHDIAPDGTDKLVVECRTGAASSAC